MQKKVFHKREPLEGQGFLHCTSNDLKWLPKAKVGKFSHVLEIFSVLHDMFPNSFPFLSHSLNAQYNYRVKNLWNHVWIFLPKKSLQNRQKKSIFSGTIGNHILGICTQWSLRALVCKTLFLDDPIWQCLNFIILISTKYHKKIAQT